MGGTSLSGRWSACALVLLIRQGGTHVGETAPSTLLGPEGSGPLVQLRESFLRSACGHHALG